MATELECVHTYIYIYKLHIIILCLGKLIIYKVYKNNTKLVYFIYI